jgi:ribonuclease HII
VLSCTSLWIHKSFIHIENPKKQAWLTNINDSKKLSEKKRNVCFDLILNEFNLNKENIPFSNETLLTPNNLNISKTQLHYKAEKFLTSQKQNNSIYSNEFECISFVLGESSASEIDKYNIWNAVQIAASRALLKLYNIVQKRFPFIYNQLNNAIILMDGKHFIKVPKEYCNNIQVTVTQGDGIFVSVGFSSIIAKVFRDSFMSNQHTLFPSFHFSEHKGYGTPKHLALIQKIGTCPLHRKSFLTNYCPQTLF